MSKENFFESNIPEFDPENVRFHNLRYCATDAEEVLKSLTWDRSEKSFKEVRQSILAGDIHLAIRLFTFAPDTAWICRILGKDNVCSVWTKIKEKLDPKSPMYAQCELFFEEYIDWIELCCDIINIQQEKGANRQPPLPEGRGLRVKTCEPGVDQGER